MNLETNRELETAWKFIKDTDVSVFLTGKAGSGKTTFLRKVKEELQKRMVVVAPTGVAAINAKGMTIHSFFQLPIGIHLPESQMKRERNFFQMSKQKKNILRTLDLLIIDEISMVRCDLLDAINDVLRKYKDPYLPFGGVQLLMIGDLQQLAPVTNEQEWELLKTYYDTPYFFSSKSLQRLEYITIELKKIYRQEDDRFIALLSNIRNGQLDTATVAALNERYIPGFEAPAGTEYIRLTTHNYKADQYNNFKLSQLPGISHQFHCEVEGDFPENSYPASADLELKLGTQVMFIRNDSGGERYFNGKIGKVVGFSDYGILVQGFSDPVPICVEMSEWENSEYTVDAETKEITEKVIGRFRQYPLRMAWAITVHKSQGLTFDHAILDINQSFAHGQVYVALSRCRSLDGLVLTSPLRVKTLSKDEAVISYMDRELQTAEQSYGRYEDLKSRYFLRLLDEQFGFDKLMSCINDMVRLFNEFLYKSHAELCSSWTAVQSTFAKGVLDVSQKFKMQYDRMLNEGHDESSPVLQERIHKAADYFCGALSKELTGLASASNNLTIKNKQTLKRYENTYDRFALELRLKCYTLAHLDGHDFSVSDYLYDKARAVLTDAELEREKKVRNRKKGSVSDEPVKKRAPKGTTQRLSLEMLRSGKNYNEIAAERMLSPNTVFGHLKGFVSTGELRWDEVLIPGHVEFVSELFERNGKPAQISDYNQLLPRDICTGEYYQIAQMLGCNQ